jgi:3-hydroxyisobutyrate dehydrogenase-like beta-hydroxyacid dehydrogenase
MEALPDLDAVVGEADLVVAILVSKAAEPLAVSVAEAMRRTGATPLYLDLNSIAPATAEAAEQAILAAGGTMVDGCIVGSSKGIPGESGVYLSGARAAEVQARLSPPFRMDVLGDRVGQASGFKVLYAGLSKGLWSLGVELMAGVEAFGLQEALLKRYAESFPDVADFWERALPTLPPRAARRAQEMDELAETLEAMGLDAYMARGAQATLEALAARYGASKGAAAARG